MSKIYFMLKIYEEILLRQMNDLMNNFSIVPAGLIRTKVAYSNIKRYYQYNKTKKLVQDLSLCLRKYLQKLLKLSSNALNYYIIS